MSPAVWSSRPAAAVSRWRSGCSPVSAARASRCARRVGQDGSLVSSGMIWSAWVELCNDLGSNELLGCDMEAVGVALNRLEQPGSRVGEFSQQRGGGGGRFIAGEDLLQRLGRRAR